MSRETNDGGRTIIYDPNDNHLVILPTVSAKPNRIVTGSRPRHVCRNGPATARIAAFERPTARSDCFFDAISLGRPNRSCRYVRVWDKNIADRKSNVIAEDVFGRLMF